MADASLRFSLPHAGSFDTLIIELSDVLFSSVIDSDEGTGSQKALQQIRDSATWFQYEKGLISEADCYSGVAKELGLHADEVSRKWQKHSTSLAIQPCMVDLIRSLKPGRRIYAMTNLSNPDWKRLESTVIGLDLFEAVFTSCSASERKPNLAFYRHVIRAIHDNPRRTIFIDPSLENVVTARSFGMKAVLYEDPDRLRRTLFSLCFDSVDRGQFFMRLNAGKHLSFTSTGHTIQENFSQMLILEATRDPSLVSYTKFNGLFNFFRARGELTTHNFPYDADSTSIGVTVCDNISPATREHVMDEILKLRNSDGIIQVYFDASRPRIDPVVCVNVLTLFHTYGRGDQLKDTFNWVEDVLIHRAYLNGTRYYEPAEAFLFFFSRLLSVSSVARLRLRKAYAQRCRERIGMKGDALALAMRIICCTLEGIDASLDLRTLREMQQIDGGWDDGWFYKYGSTGVLIANRGLTTALAIKAIELAEGRWSDLRVPSRGEQGVQVGQLVWPKGITFIDAFRNGVVSKAINYRGAYWIGALLVLSITLLGSWPIIVV